MQQACEFPESVVDAGPALTLSVLGRVRVAPADDPGNGILLPAKSQGLLIYLAMTGRRVRREVLADMFWGDTGEEGARANLRLALTKLRQRLPGVVHADAETVGLNPATPLEVDALFVLRAAEAVAQQGPAALGSAISHYQGPFAADFFLRDCASFEDWVNAERRRIDRSAVVILRELVRHERAARQLHSEQHYLELWARIEPWNEEPQMALIQHLARGGNVAAALDQFEACRTALAEERGTRPSDELAALADQVRRGDLPRDQHALACESNARPVDPIPLLGREEDLRRIRLCLRHGERLLTLLGPAGVGKSRLAKALAEERNDAYPDGYVSCNFDFVERGASEDALREHMVAALGSVLGLDFTQTAQPMAMLKKHLAGRRMILGLDGFEACVGAAAAVVELVHAAPRCLFLVTSRVRLAVADELIYELHGLGSDPGEGDFALELLLLCSRRVGVKLNEVREREHLGRLVHLLEGSPLAIQFAAQALRTFTPEQLTHRLEAGAWLDTSPYVSEYRHRTLQDVMGDMWGQLDEASQEAWARCALFRGTFSRDWAVECAAVDDSCVTLLVERSILSREPAGRFRMHELTRQYGLSMLAARADAGHCRRTFSRAVLAQLVNLAPRLERDEAGVLERLKADISTIASAVDHEIGLTSPQEIDRPMVVLCRVYHRMGWHFAAARLLEQTLARHPHAPPAYLMVWHHMAGALAYNQFGDLHDSPHFKEVLSLAKTSLPAAGVDGWFRGLASGVRALVARPMVAAKDRLAQRALAHTITRLLMTRFGDDAGGPELFAGLGVAWLAARRSGMADARLAVLLKALVFLSTYRQGQLVAWLVRRVRRLVHVVDRVQEAYALQQLGNVMIVNGHWDEARTLLQRAGETLAAQGYTYDSLECRTQLCAVLLHHGEFARLLAELQLVETEARTMEQPAILRWALQLKLQAVLRSQLDGVAQAQACLRDIHAITLRRTRLEEVRILGAEALLASAQGNVSQVMAHARGILELMSEVSRGRIYTLFALTMVIDALLPLAGTGNATAVQANELAARAIKKYLALSGHLPALAARRLMYRGWLAALAGHKARAIRRWHEALRACDHRASTYDLAVLHHLLGVSLTGPAALPHAQAAQMHFSACGLAGPRYPLMP